MWKSFVDGDYTDSGDTEYIGRLITIRYLQSDFRRAWGEDIHIDTWADEKKMTQAELDKNAGVVRDEKGNVKSEVTKND